VRRIVCQVMLVGAGALLLIGMSPRPAGALACVIGGSPSLDALVGQGTSGTIPVAAGASFSGTVDFGDGARAPIGAGGGASHTYDQAGTFPVTVSGSGTRQGTDADGNPVTLPCSNGGTRVAVYHIHLVKPVIAITSTGMTKTTETFQFDGSGSIGRDFVSGYRWSVGGGGGASTPSFTATFPRPKGADRAVRATLTLVTPAGNVSSVGRAMIPFQPPPGSEIVTPILVGIGIGVVALGAAGGLAVAGGVSVLEALLTVGLVGVTGTTAIQTLPIVLQAKLTPETAVSLGGSGN
jgi:hypothetical protein